MLAASRIRCYEIVVIDNLLLSAYSSPKKVSNLGLGRNSGCPRYKGDVLVGK